MLPPVRRIETYSGAVTVGEYAGMPLQDVGDTTRHGAIFLLRKPPISDAPVSLDGWTTQVKRGTKAVVTFGPSQATDADSAFSDALQAANNGADYMSARGLADIAILTDRDECIVWWPEGNGVAMRATVVYATVFNVTADGITRDAQGNVVPSPSLTPIHRNVFRFIRMSRTSVYLYDSYRNMFLALEWLLEAIAPKQSGEGEGGWFKRALGAASSLVPAAELAPAGEPDPITWAYDNIYRDDRSGLMHAKRNYLLPQDETARNDLIESLETISRYVHKLVEAHLGVRRLSSHMSDYLRRKFVRDVLMGLTLYVSDDSTRFHDGDEATTGLPASATTVKANPSQFTMSDRWYGHVTASWNPSTLSPLDSVCRLGGVPAAGEPGGIVSDLRGPLILGSSVTRFDLQLGFQNYDATDPPRHFLA
jgi:hypothetical protein